MYSAKNEIKLDTHRFRRSYDVTVFLWYRHKTCTELASIGTNNNLCFTLHSVNVSLCLFTENTFQLCKKWSVVRAP